MTPDLSSPFQQWKLSEAETQAALGSPLLLCYLQNKRAISASIFVSSFATAAPGAMDKEKEFINIERNRAQLQILDELINECIEATEAVHQEQQPQPPQNPEPSFF